MNNSESTAQAAMLDEGPPFDTRELANFLRVSPRTPERWRAEGTGPVYVLVGAQIRYLRRDVSFWLASRRRECTRDQV